MSYGVRFAVALPRGATIAGTVMGRPEHRAIFSPLHLAVRCPRCGAFKGSKCRGFGSVALRTTHQERVTAAARARQKAGKR
jgi:hypothetical protein